MPWVMCCQKINYFENEKSINCKNIDASLARLYQLHDFSWNSDIDPCLRKTYMFNALKFFAIPSYYLKLYNSCSHLWLREP